MRATTSFNTKNSIFNQSPTMNQKLLVLSCINIISNDCDIKFITHTFT